MKNVLCIFVIALLFCTTYAITHRYSISCGGSQRYYVIVKTDHWTGATWKLSTGLVWVQITDIDTPRLASR